ncbi:MAG TPA: hypothetical protein VHV83_19575 [Armatimonadota bacterium]|nr:hypothetical protein [Armatimonadota bacterium]
MQENDEKLPSSQAFWTAIDVPAKVRQCPTAGKTVANAYVYNDNIAGAAIGDVDYPEDTLLVADGQGTGNGTSTYDNIAYSDDNLAKRHNNATIAGYLDGHVEYNKDAHTWLAVLLDRFSGSTVPFIPYSQSGEQPSTITQSTNKPFEGETCLELHYRIATLGHYVELANNSTQIQSSINKKLHRIGIAVRGDGSESLRMAIRILDSKGEMWQWWMNNTDKKQISFSGWQMLWVDLDKPQLSNWAISGGTKNDVLDYPVKVYSFTIDYTGDTILGLDALTGYIEGKKADLLQ